MLRFFLGGGRESDKRYVHVVLWIPFLIFTFESSNPSFGGCQGFGVRTELVDLILSGGYVDKVPSVCVEKPVRFVKRCFQHWKRIWYSLRDRPVVRCGYSRLVQSMK
jgi:hypothetical protein